MCFYINDEVFRITKLLSMMRLVPDLKIEEEKTADQKSEFASNEVHCCKQSSINQSNA